MNKRIIRSVMLASLLVVNGSQNTIVNAAISGTNYNSCYSAGEKAFALSDFVNAADNFAEALKYKPDDLRSHLKYAQSLSSLNKYDESSIHLKTILQNSPNNILARICLAENYLHLGKKDCAKEQLDWILKVQPNHQKAISLYESLGYTPSNKVKVSQAPIVKKEIIKKNTELPKPVTVKEEIKNKLDNDQLKIAENTKEDTKLDNSQLKVSENIKEDAKLDNSQLKIAENIKEDKKESITIKENNSDDSMTFTPYIASNKKKVEKKDQDFEEKPKMPLAREDIQNTDMTSFFKLAKNSFIVNLEKARYEIESGDLKSAVKTLEISEKLARAGNNNRNLLETQIFKSLLYIYNCDYKNFGKHLMTLKSVLSTESYQSFLDIYSKADDIKNEDDKKRLSAGVAIGAGHYAVAVSLLKPVFDKNPDNFPVYEMLLESQLNSMNYNGAEETLKKFVEINPDDEEANFNLSRFYLTGSYNPELAKKYAEKASELSPKDARPKIIIALTDYSEGKVEEGISKIKTLMSELEDASMKAICQRLVTDGENLSSESKENFVSMIALPGSKFSEPSSLRFVGEDYLKAGSYFSAIDKFKRADEKVEMGRAYLGLASSLASSNDSEVASIAAGYGLRLIKEDMSRGKNISRASLYKALYDFERGDKESALACIDLGLNCKDLDLSTYNKLVNLYDNLSL